MPPRTLDPTRAAELGRQGGQARRVAAVERRIRELVDSAPPLSESQKARLVALLAPRDAA